MVFSFTPFVWLIFSLLPVCHGWSRLICSVMIAFLSVAKDDYIQEPFCTSVVTRSLFICVCQKLLLAVPLSHSSYQVNIWKRILKIVNKSNWHCCLFLNIILLFLKGHTFDHLTFWNIFDINRDLSCLFPVTVGYLSWEKRKINSWNLYNSNWSQSKVVCPIVVIKF